MRKTVILFVLIALSLSVLPGCVKKQQEVKRSVIMQTFTNPNMAITFKYPEYYREIPAPASMGHSVGYRIDNYSSLNLLISKTELYSPLSLQQLGVTLEGDVEKVDGAKVLASVYFNIGEIPAHRYTASGKLPGSPSFVILEQVSFIMGNDLYRFYYTATTEKLFKQYRPSFEELVKSISLK